MKTRSNKIVTVVAALLASIALTAAAATPALSATTTASSSLAPSAVAGRTVELSARQPGNLTHFSLVLATRIAP